MTAPAQHNAVKSGRMTPVRIRPGYYYPSAINHARSSMEAAWLTTMLSA